MSSVDDEDEAAEAAEADDAVELDIDEEGGPSYAQEDDVEGEVPLPGDAAAGDGTDRGA
jgi:hypothetical protein